MFHIHPAGGTINGGIQVAASVVVRHLRQVLHTSQYTQTPVAHGFVSGLGKEGFLRAVFSSAVGQFLADPEATADWLMG